MAKRGERRRNRLRLTVAEVTAAPDSAPASEFPLLWAAPAAGLAAVALGWLLTTGLVMVAWFTAMAMPLPRVLGFAAQLWLAGHGAGAEIGEVLVTLTPLGFTVLLVLLARTVVGLGLRFAPRDSLEGTGALRACGLVAAGYGLGAGIVALSAGAGPRIGWAVLGGLVVGALATGWVLAGRLRRLIALPSMLVGLPRAVLAGLGTLTVLAAAVLVTGLLLGSHRVSLIEQSLAADPVGGWLLVGLQLLFLPNLLAWSASWVLGAGFSVGAGSLVSPMLTTAGLLPAVPVLGAVPESGLGGPWSYLWLLSGVLAGAAAGWVATRGATARTTLVGCLARGAGSGLATAAMVVLIGLLARGDLGAGRLIGLGPVMLNLVLLAPGLLVAGGALAAAVRWWLGERRSAGVDDERTEVLARPDDAEAETVPLAGL